MDVKEKIENMKPVYLWLLFVILYVSFSTEVLWRPFIFAEDTVFLNNALTDGFRSLFYRHAEYWEIISRLSANLAIFLGSAANSYLVTAFVMKTAAIAMFSYYIVYFAAADFSWLVKERWKRFAISLIVLIWFGNFFNLYYSITSLHWAGEFFLFLVGLNLVFNKKFPGIFCLIICLLTCMNSPEACMVSIPFAIYIMNRAMERSISVSEILGFLLVVAAAFLQLCAVMQSGNSSNVTDAGNILSALPKSLFSVTTSGAYVLGNETMSYLNPAFVLMSGGLIWFFIIFSYMKIGRAKGMLFLLYVLAFLFMHYMIIHIKPLNARHFNYDYWVHSCPGAVLAWSFFCAAVNMKSVVCTDPARQIFLLFCAVILLTEVSHAGKIDGLDEHYKTYDYDMLGMGLIEDAEPAVDFSSRRCMVLKLYAGWRLFVPVRNEL